MVPLACGTPVAIFDAAAGAGDDGDFVVSVHHLASLGALAQTLHDIPCGMHAFYHDPLHMSIGIGSDQSPLLILNDYHLRSRCFQALNRHFHAPKEADVHFSVSAFQSVDFVRLLSPSPRELLQ